MYFFWQTTYLLCRLTHLARRGVAVRGISTEVSRLRIVVDFVHAAIGLRGGLRAALVTAKEALYLQRLCAIKGGLSQGFLRERLRKCAVHFLSNSFFGIYWIHAELSIKLSYIYVEANLPTSLHWNYPQIPGEITHKSLFDTHLDQTGLLNLSLSQIQTALASD